MSTATGVIIACAIVVTACLVMAWVVLRDEPGQKRQNPNKMGKGTESDRDRDA